MNQVRHDLPDSLTSPRELDEGGDLPPIEPPDPGGGRPGPEPRPSGNHRRYLPWLALGALLLAVERLAMITLAMGGLDAEVYAAAAAIFLTVVLVGLAVGGRAFHRAYHAAQDRPYGDAGRG